MLERIVLKKNAVFVSVGKDCLHRQFFKEYADFRPASAYSTIILMSS